MDHILQFSENVIVCNGEFPSHIIPKTILENAKTIICCDGAANNLLANNIEPTVVIGDLDSISEEAKLQFKSKLIHNTDQNTNDQTKAIQWAISQGLKNVVILGATGKREDHTIGNISLLLTYIDNIQVVTVTDYGVFIPIKQTQSFKSFKGQQVSIFSLTPPTQINSTGLMYPLESLSLQSWWMGTLNESIENEFSLEFQEGALIVNQNF